MPSKDKKNREASFKTKGSLQSNPGVSGSENQKRVGQRDSSQESFPKTHKYK